jgi:hypothetical protein
LDGGGGFRVAVPRAESSGLAGGKSQKWGDEGVGGQGRGKGRRENSASTASGTEGVSAEAFVVKTSKYAAPPAFSSPPRAPPSPMEAGAWGPSRAGGKKDAAVTPSTAPQQGAKGTIPAWPSSSAPSPERPTDPSPSHASSTGSSIGGDGGWRIPSRRAGAVSSPPPRHPQTAPTSGADSTASERRKVKVPSW